MRGGTGGAEGPTGLTRKRAEHRRASGNAIQKVSRGCRRQDQPGELREGVQGSYEVETGRGFEGVCSESPMALPWALAVKT